MNYTVTLNEDELQFLRFALRAIKHEAEHATLGASLNAAKPVRAPRKAVKASAPAINTGDRALDAFMHRARQRRMDAGKPLMLSAPKLNAKLPGLLWPSAKRPLNDVLAEAEAVARANGWPGTYNVLGTKVDA